MGDNEENSAISVEEKRKIYKNFDIIRKRFSFLRKKIFKKLKKRTIKRLKKVFKILIFILLYLSIIVFVVYLRDIIFNQNKKITDEKQLSIIAEKINYYYYTWVEFHRLKGKMIHSLWNEKFHNATYELNGQARYNKYDCLSAIYFFLQDRNSNFPLMKVEFLYAHFKNVTEKRKKYKDIKVRDLIIIYVKGNWHIAIVEGKFGNRMLKYCDVNIKSNGPGYREISFDSRIIKGVYPISFEMWIGNLLKYLKEIESINIKLNIIESGSNDKEQQNE